MCGIVGYVGNGDAVEVILEGLSKLEYRGYDSSGIAIVKNGQIQIEKKVGKLQALKDFLSEHPMSGEVGLGHTRWATHGAPSDINSHPHYNNDKSVAVVHNGIIENYIQLKKELTEQGCNFISQTDTEVVAHLFGVLYDGDMLSTLKKLLKRIKGTYALGIVHKNHPDQLICARKDSPLVIGVGENQNFIASDVPALLKYTKNVYFLENGDYADIQKNKVTIYDENDKEVKREKHEIKWTLEQATKGGYPHFMIKEIYEQADTLKETLKRRVNYDDYSLDFKDILSKEEALKIEEVQIIACGTAYHAGLQGEYALEKIAKIRTSTDIASEYRYSDPFVNKNTLAMVVSQSGETLDTLLAMKECKKRGATTLAVTNVVGSSISRDADKVIYTMAGPEIAVASTKAYTNQVLTLFLLAIYLADERGVIDFDTKKLLLDELRVIPEKINEILKSEGNIKDIAQTLVNTTSGFYIGRGLDYRVALEGSLKMKEITYIHTEAFASGELKHGTISLIEEGIPAVVLATQSDLIDKSDSNIKELKARHATIITVTQEKNVELKESSDKIIFIPNCIDIVAGILSVIPLQLLAYYTSVLKGIDVDKPRNLAKSVTVE
ncbi:MAG: glutamine--fructose-6-phosphate transaminase (isomerizing) [Fusobacteriaceae bacterium]|nr:glutamine--fructose-6-phosphate transaminase (isomerizing) [Fusobacteriaceae bacterium]